MIYADLHIHALFGVDDGASCEEEMYKMINLAYESGTRIMCLTPHFHPGYFGDNRESTIKSYVKLNSYVKDRFPTFKLSIGNELRYDMGCISWLKEGICLTLNKTRYVLVDFRDDETEVKIQSGLERLLCSGYVPVLAHPERYRRIRNKKQMIHSLKKDGVIIQLDAQSITGDSGFFIKHQSHMLLSSGLVDLIASDAHDCIIRSPDLSRCFAYLEKKYGSDYAKKLCYINAEQILNNTFDRKG